MKIKGNSKKFVLKYLAIFFVCLVLSRAQINDLSPFLLAFFFAGIYVGCEEKLLSIFTLCSALAVDPSLDTLLINVTAVAVGLVVFYIFKFIKRPIPLYLVFLSYLLGLATYIYYHYSQFLSLLYYIALGLICLYVFIIVLHVLLLRKNCFKLTLNESVCFLFAIAILAMGLAPIYIYEFSIYRFVLICVIFLFVSTGNAPMTFAITLSFSLGVGLGSLNLLPLAEFALLTLVANLFSMPSKFKIVFVVVLSDVFLQLYFFNDGMNLFFNVLPILLAGLIFFCIPNKILNSFSDFVYVKKSELSSRNLINTTRKNIRKRMSELSNVFLDMKQIHLNMVKKDLTKEELIAMLTREIMNTCCKDCLDKNRCTRSLGTDNKSSLELLIEIAVTKGKVTLLDIPSGLSNRCGKINNLISLINRLSSEYKQYKNMLADVNNVKILLADQMGAVSRLLLDIGDEIDTNVSFDIARENKIISRLLSLNIECKEVLLYTEKDENISAVLIMKNQEIYNPLIEKVMTEVLKMQMEITSIVPIEEGDFFSVTLRRKNKYDCVFGLAGCNKSGNLESGDCHSIIRLGGDRFLLALCDGMGSGKGAHKMSATTLGLIEDFYKVGFENDVVLESVNKLLAINNQENYSTLDVCLIDLNNEIADFIKVGSPFGLVKRDGNIEIIEGGALPIGALDSVSPATKKTTISTKDIVIMMTDGITDAFSSQENVIEYVSKLASNNPQTLAESILNEALRISDNTAKDDMTVLVARMYLKSN